jgi:uncharacterized membrane protein
MTASHAGAAPVQPTDQRSRLGRITVTLVVLSAVGMVLLIVGSIAGWKGFSEDENDVSTFADIVWSTFALAGILALVTGVVAWVRGRRSGGLGDVRAGQLAVAWVALAIAVSAIWSALD